MPQILAKLITADKRITLNIDGASYTIAPGHPSYAVAYKAYKDGDAQGFIDSLNVDKAMDKFVNQGSNGTIIIENGVVKYKGSAVHDCISSRIIDMMRDGEDISSMVKFLENIMENPSYNSRTQLFNFLSHKNLPITEDGCFLAYKTVRQDWYDKYSGTIQNKVGSTIEVDRSLVDDNSSHHCSHGLHVGALAYAGPGGWYNSSDDRVIIVKVNPRDAVSVPGDHSYQKLRVCKYLVFCEYRAPLYRSAYQTSGDEDIYNNNEESYEDVVDDDELFFEDDIVDYIEPNEMEVGCSYEFGYTAKDGTNSVRRVYVESIGDEYLVGELLSGDPSYSGEMNYRRFNLSSIYECEALDV